MKKIVIVIVIVIVVSLFFLNKKVDTKIKKVDEKIKKVALELQDKKINFLSYPNSSSEFHTYTIATTNNEELEILLESMQDKKISLQVIGLGNKWLGFGARLKWLYSYLEKQKISNEDIVLFVDAYDVVFLSQGKEIKEKFLKFNSPIVFAAEKGCWPDESFASLYPKTSSKYKYLNAGTYIGYVGAIKEAIKEINPEDKDDDQLAFTKYFLKYPEKIALDYNCELFLPLYDVDPATIEVVEGETMNRVKNLETGSMPSILHGNGPSKKLLFETYYNKLRKSKS